MDGGKFEMSDVPGMVPSQEEVRTIAERMARELYPEKFNGVESPVPYGRPMFWQTLEDGTVIGPEDFDRQNEEAQRGVEKQFAATVAGGQILQVEPVAPASDLSPISRLFAAVRAVLDNSGDPHTCEGSRLINAGLIEDLRAAYDALKLTDG